MSSEPETCPICLKPIGNRTTLVPCGHAFDIGCLQQWLTVGKTCPLCVAPAEKFEDSDGIVEHADSYLHRNKAQLKPVLEEDDDDSSQSAESEFQSSPSESEYSDDNDSSVSRDSSPVRRRRQPVRRKVCKV